MNELSDWADVADILSGIVIIYAAVQMWRDRPLHPRFSKSWQLRSQWWILRHIPKWWRARILKDRIRRNDIHNPKPPMSL